MKLSSIQYLRAIAAIGVLLSHGSESLYQGRVLIPLTLGAHGVDLFFVISGFIMFYTTADGQMGPGIFMTRRLIRIVPIYFLLTTAAFAVAVIFPHVARTYSPQLLDYLRSIAFIPYYNLQEHAVRPELGVGWTLNYEMFFYLLFAVSLLLKPLQRVAVCAVIFLALVLTGLFANPTNIAGSVYTNPIILEFAFGVAIGYLATNKPEALGRGTLAALAMAAAVEALLFLAYPAAAGRADESLRLLQFGVPSAAFVCGALWLERDNRVRHWPLLVLMGDASYSLYLSHIFVLALLRRIWTRLFDINLLATHAAFIAVNVLVAVAASLVMFRYLESPITRYLMGALRRKRPEQPPLVTEERQAASAVS